MCGCAAAEAGMILYEPSYPRVGSTARPNNSGSTKYSNPLLASAAKLRKSSRCDFPKRMRATSALSQRSTGPRAALCHSHVNPRHRKKRINQFSKRASPRVDRPPTHKRDARWRDISSFAIRTEAPSPPIDRELCSIRERWCRRLPLAARQVSVIIPLSISVHTELSRRTRTRPQVYAW